MPATVNLDLFKKSESGFLSYPLDPALNYAFRDQLITLAKDDVTIQAALRHQCSKDILFYFNAFLWTLDPRKQHSDIPFVTYPFQDKLIIELNNHILNKKDVLIEKSRDMGVTWCGMGTFLYQWTFNPSFLGHLGSKTEDDVDHSGDSKCLFEKLRYLIKKLPYWLLPYGFDYEKHNMFMRLISPAGSLITGESANANFSRQGRYTAVWLDEFASAEYQEEIWRATADSTPCRIVCSTPKGSGNKFWELRFKSPIDTISLHWTLHPDKSVGLYDVNGKKHSTWYDAECSRRSAVDIAQELDIDYIISGNPYFDVNILKTITTVEPQFGVIINERSKYSFRPTNNGLLRLFKPALKSMEYVIGADSSEGLSEGDNSTLAVRDKLSNELVCGYVGKLKPEEFAELLYKVSIYYNNAIIGCENNGYGYTVNQILYEMGAHLYRMSKFDEGTRQYTLKLGWSTNAKTRPLILSQLAQEIKEGSHILNDQMLVNECMNFIFLDGKEQAAEGSHDDYIFADAIAGEMRRLYPFKPTHDRRPARQPWRGLSGY